MNKIQIDEYKYVELLNAKMKTHESFKCGMSVELSPNSDCLPFGYKIIGGNNASSIFSWADNQLKTDYELILSK